MAIIRYEDFCLLSLLFIAKTTYTLLLNSKSLIFLVLSTINKYTTCCYKSIKYILVFIGFGPTGYLSQMTLLYQHLNNTTNDWCKNCRHCIASMIAQAEDPHQDC